MYRHLPQINLVLEMINNNDIGDIISMNSSFGVNILTKKKFFFFNKKKKINPFNRLFDKKLGGGCILDLGCYPISFSLLIGSLKEKLDKIDLKIENAQKEIGETNVDIDAYAKLSFSGGFFSQIAASFKNNLGSVSEIKGDKGLIKINNTWFGGDKIIKKKNNHNQIIDTKDYGNIYSYQIKNISKNISSNIFQPQYPGMSLNETLLNMKTLDEWLNA